MVTQRDMRRTGLERGTTMLEVLVAIVVLTVGLLGLAGLQSRLQVSEIEAYQRSQAVMLVNDMASRMAANRHNASDYTTSSALGASCPTDTSSQANIDKKAWCEAIQGAAEVNSASVKVGTLVNGRGCIELLSGNEYIVMVVWTGLVQHAAPPNLGCSLGQDQKYGATGRVVATLVKAPSL